MGRCGVSGNAVSTPQVRQFALFAQLVLAGRKRGRAATMSEQG